VFTDVSSMKTKRWYQASPARVSIAGEREPHPSAPVRQREGLFLT
jgi:hypothetical protein